MAYLATNIFDGDGTTTEWEFSFAGVASDSDSGTTPYLYPADVKALELYRDVDGNAQAATRNVTLVAPNRARIEGGAVAVGRRIKIYRQTEIRFPLVDYRDRQAVSDLDLDLANRQAIFVAQETQDAASNNMALDRNENYDVLNRRIVNLAPGIDPGDAVNLDQLRHAIRVPADEPAISALPSPAERANKLLSFDALGNPVMSLPASGSATELELELAAPTGATKVGFGTSTVSSSLTELYASLAALQVEYETLHLVYSPPATLVVDRITQLINYNGTFYKLRVPAAVPVTLSGVWATDKALLMDAGFVNIRQDLDLQRADLIAQIVALEAELRSRVIESSNDSAEIKTSFEQGGVMRMSNGVHYLLSEMTFTYVGVVGFPGHASPRQTVVGENRGGTIGAVQHSGWAMQSLGPAPFTQAAGGYDEFGNMTLVGPNVTAAAGAVGDGKGLKITNRAQTYVHDMLFMNLEQAFHFDGILSSVMERIDVSGCAVPSVMDTTDLTSAPNAVQLNQWRFANNPNGGAHMEAGAAMAFNGLTLEGNGHDGLGIGALNIYSSHEPFAGTVTFNNVYAELNHGLCDLYIENKTIAPMTVVINGGLWARVSGTRYVQSHIVVNSTGGGTVDVYWNNPQFIEGFGYVPSVARPLWREITDKCRVHCVNPTFQIGVDTPIPVSQSAGSHIAMHLEATGGLYAPQGWSALNISTGVTVITRNTPIAGNLFSYIVHPTPATHNLEADLPIYRVRARRLTNSQFRIHVSDDAGNPINGGVDISVISMN